MKLAFISDIHEDVVSLQVAMRKIEKSKVDKVICLGDISGYSAKHYDHIETRDAHECLNIIKQNCSVILLGNHDFHAIKKIPDISPGFHFPSDWYDLDIFEKKQLSNKRLWIYEDTELQPAFSKADIAFLSELRQVKVMEVEGYNILLSHYVYPNISGMETEYFLDHKGFAQHFNYMDKLGAFLSITGHEHTPGLLYITGKKICMRRFGKRKLKFEKSIVMCPAVAAGKNKNGFMILDTKTFKAEARTI